MEKIKNTSPDFKNNAKKIKSGLRKKQAFTLVELIVVITILAILGTIAFISLQGYSRDARDATRTADLGNIKTSLELFSLKTGKFPSPDSFSTITYSGGTENVWFQGNVGDIVTTNLKSLNEKPLDPLTNTPYTYSVTNSYKEYEVLALYEGSVAYQVPSPFGGGLGRGVFPQANAAVTSLTPKIVGNYNGVFVKTTNYIIPVPSIVIAEPLLTGTPLELTSSSIKSLVMTNGTNIPSNTITSTQTGALNVNLSVYTGSITKSSGTGAMITAVQQIQGAYTGTTLATNNNIAYILNQTTNDQLIALGNITILKGGDPLVINNTPIILTGQYKDCLSQGQLIYTTIDGTDTGLTCLNDIIICDGSGSGYTVSACNAGASTVYTGISQIFASNYFRNPSENSWAGGLYQWGNKSEISNATYTTGQLGGSTVSDSMYSNILFRRVASDWLTIPNNNLWGYHTGAGTNIQKKGPCNIGYHVPTVSEWNGVITAGDGVGKLWNILGTTTETTDFVNILKIPKGGGRLNYGGAPFGALMGNQSYIGYYWTSQSGNLLSFYTTIELVGMSNSYGNSVRCFKN